MPFESSPNGEHYDDSTPEHRDLRLIQHLRSEIARLTAHVKALEQEIAAFKRGHAPVSDSITQPPTLNPQAA